MLTVMRTRAPILACLILALAAPLAAQDADDEGTIGEGLRLFQEGTRLLLEGLMDELGPQLQEFRDAIGDLDAYHAPEVLPNGDILIRRKTPLQADDLSDGEMEI